MLMEERFQEILKIVGERKSVTVQELTELLQTSESTIRRDLTQLHKRGRLTKVHGGATVPEMNYETKDPNLETRYDLNKEAKIKVAKYAASLIKPDDFIFMDGGTTTELIIDFITEKNPVYVTNAIEQARKLVHKGCQIFLLGGELKGDTEATVGESTVEELKKLSFTKGFLGTNGISLENGYSTPEIHEAMVKRIAMERCMERYIVCDASKFNQISPVSFGSYDDAVIITTKVDNELFYGRENIIEVDRSE